MAGLAGSGWGWCAQLLSEGLRMAPGRTARELVLAYILGADSRERVPARSDAPARGPSRKDLLRPVLADARQSAGTGARDGGIASVPETPPDTSCADPPCSPGAGSPSPSTPHCSLFSFLSVAVNHRSMDALCGPTSKWKI